MFNLRAETEKVLTASKITPPEGELDKFVKSVQPNIDLIFKVKKENPEDYNLVVTHDKTSKHSIPVLFTFTRKKKK